MTFFKLSFLKHHGKVKILVASILLFFPHGVFKLSEIKSFKPYQIIVSANALNLE